jgi:putative oxidoreductase
MWRKLFPTSRNDFTLTIARAVLAVIFFAHGSQKMFGLFGGRGIQGTIEIFQSTMGLPAPVTLLVMFTEVFGAVGLALGLLSRVAALGVGVIMMVAPFANHLYPRFFMNWTGRQTGEGYEYHLLALALAISVAARGGGAWSLDGVIASRAANPARGGLASGATGP